MGKLESGLRSILGGKSGRPDAKNTITIGSGVIAGASASEYLTSEQKAAMKLSTVSRCVEVLCDSMGKLPIYIIDKNTKNRVESHPLLSLLQLRPNEVQTPKVFMQMVEGNRLCGGNGYAWIQRDRKSGRPVALIPIPSGEVNVYLDEKTGTPRYDFKHPFTGRPVIQAMPSDMLHLMGYTYNGWKGVSVLERAAEVIGTGKAAQQYSLSYYANGGQPVGLLSTDTDLGGTVNTVENGKQVTKSKKDVIRDEWNKRYGGPNNAGSVAVLDLGLKYTPISINNRDAQFVEQSELSVQDIARFFGVPLYKLQAGKQSYSSNEQNAVEYVVGTLHPIVTQYEQELTYKLLTMSEIEKGLEIKINMLAELKGDTGSRSTWYRNMREISAFSPNDIRALEDLPDIEGGDEYSASLNYVPLSDWKRLSQERAAGRGGINQ